MVPTLALKHNLREVTLAFQDFGEAYVNLATPRALNRTATTTRAEAARQIGKTYNMKIGAAKGQMVIQRAGKNYLIAKIVVSGRPIPLVQFDARQVRAGVSVKVKGDRKVVGHAFIATMKSGHVGVYERLARGKGSGRLPIRQLFSLSLPVAFTQKTIVDAIMAVVGPRFKEALAQELRFIQIRNMR